MTCSTYLVDSLLVCKSVRGGENYDVLSVNMKEFLRNYKTNCIMLDGTNRSSLQKTARKCVQACDVINLTLVGVKIKSVCLIIVSHENTPMKINDLSFSRSLTY